MEAVTQSSLALPRHFRHIARLFSAAALFLTPFIIVESAHADFRVCNSTQNLVGVAIGYRAQDGWVSEGWWQVPSSTCATLIEGELQSRYYYLYAEDAAHGGRWTGDVNMHVSPQASTSALALAFEPENPTEYRRDHKAHSDASYGRRVWNIREFFD